MENYDAVLSAIQQSETIYLYGAGIFGYGVAEALDRVYSVSVKAHIVSEKDSENTIYAGRHVVAFSELSEQLDGALVLVATPAVYHAEIEALLNTRKDCRFIILTHQDIYEFMRRYYKENYGFQSLADLRKKGNGFAWGNIDCRIYMAASVHDKALKAKYGLPPYIRRVQAGAALAKSCADGEKFYARDNEGDNISDRNANYSELTVTYWAWKNERADYKGICHYRRILDLSEKEYAAVFANDIDVVLPFPYLCYGDTSFQYARYTSAEDVSLMFDAISDDEREEAKEILSGQYLYNHNMMIAKETVFDDYCQWVFPVLDRIERRLHERGEYRSNRYAGYLGEILTSVYFTKRRHELKIVHAPELWIV